MICWIKSVFAKIGRLFGKKECCGGCPEKKPMGRAPKDIYPMW